jgi:hypothetical protein
VAKKEEERRLEELFAMEAKQEEASSPKILVPHPLIAGEERAKKKGSKTLLNVAALLLVLGAGAFTAYRFGALDDVLKMAGIIKPAPSRPAPAVAKAPPPKPASPVTTTPVATSAIPAASSADANAAENPPAVSAPLLEEKNPATVVDAANETEWKDNTGSSGKRAASSASRLNPADSAARIRSRAAPATGSAKRNSLQPAANSGTQPGTVAGNAAAPVSPSNGADSSIAAAADTEGVVAPKLIRGHKSMAPPDMIRNYITGSVNVDAVVDSTGHVRSVTVVSGPEKLRATAIEEMKQYLYQPAKKNGKPVPAHVQVSLQFWYEP